MREEEENPPSNNTGEDLKPCVICGNECAIFKIQLRDIFSRKYLRLCDGKCLFAAAYDYLYELYEHQNFDNSLEGLENEEDKALRNKERDQELTYARESLQKGISRAMLATPMPESISRSFEKTPIALGGCTVRFIKPTKEEKIEWQKKYVEQQRGRLAVALEDLQRMEAEIG